MGIRHVHSAKGKITRPIPTSTHVESDDEESDDEETITREPQQLLNATNTRRYTSAIQVVITATCTSLFWDVE